MRFPRSGWDYYAVGALLGELLDHALGTPKHVATVEERLYFVHLFSG